MKREEFDKKTRTAAFLRCKGLCEKCQGRLKIGGGEYDHVIPYFMTQDSTLSNCQVLCTPCHRGIGAKTANDQRDISKVKRVEAKHTGTVRPAGQMKSPSFPKTEKALSRTGKLSLPPRNLYEGPKP